MIFYPIFAAAALASPTGVYGITIGAPLSFRECVLIPLSDADKKRAERYAKRGLSYLAEAMPRYEAPTGGPCYKRLSKDIIGAPVGTEKVHVEFPTGERLAGNDGSSVAIQMIEGRVGYVRFNTRGRLRQDEDLETFKSKFGKPESLSTVPLQNGFGARYEALKATWMPAPGIVACFESWISERSGNFGIGTPEAERLFWQIPKELTRSL